MHATDSKPNRSWIAMLQLLVGLGLVAFLIVRMDNRSDLIEAVAEMRHRWWLPLISLACFFGCLSVACRRWTLILRERGMALPFTQALYLYIVGHFFNAFMLGALGGDLIKVIMVAQRFPTKRVEAASSVLIDRIMGLFALVALAATVVLVRWSFFMTYPLTRLIALIMTVGVVALGVGSLIVFRQNIFEQWSWLKRSAERFKFVRGLQSAYLEFYHSLNHPSLLMKCFALSLINHLLLIVASFALGLALNIQTLSPPPALESPSTHTIHYVREFESYLTVFPIVNGIAALPITPGALGTRDFVTQSLLGMEPFNVPASRAIALSLMIYAMTLFWSLVGGILYIAGSSHSAIKHARTMSSPLDG